MGSSSVGPDEFYVVERFELSRDSRALIGGGIPAVNFQIRLQPCVGFRGILGMQRGYLLIERRALRLSQRGVNRASVLRILEHDGKFRQIIRAIAMAAHCDEVSFTMLDRKEFVKGRRERFAHPLGIRLRVDERQENSEQRRGTEPREGKIGDSFAALAMTFI